MRSPGLSRSTGEDLPCESWQKPPFTPRITWSRLATPIQNVVTCASAIASPLFAYSQLLQPRHDVIRQRARFARRAIDHHHRGVRGRGAFALVEDRLQE